MVHSKGRGCRVIHTGMHLGKLHPTPVEVPNTFGAAHKMGRIWKTHLRPSLPPRGCAPPPPRAPAWHSSPPPTHTLQHKQTHTYTHLPPALPPRARTPLLHHAPLWHLPAPNTHTKKHTNMHTPAPSFAVACSRAAAASRSSFARRSPSTRVTASVRSPRSDPGI